MGFGIRQKIFFFIVFFPWWWSVQSMNPFFGRAVGIRLIDAPVLHPVSVSFLFRWSEFYSFPQSLINLIVFVRCLRDYSTLLLGGRWCLLHCYSRIVRGTDTKGPLMSFGVCRCSSLTVCFLPNSLAYNSDQFTFHYIIEIS